MNAEQWAVVTGSPFDGLTIHGPFANWEAADCFAATCDGDYWAVPIVTPSYD